MSAIVRTYSRGPVETPAEALARIQAGFSKNDEAVIYALAEAGVDPADIDPRGNVLTFNAWKAAGRRVAKGATAVRVQTWIPCGPTDDSGKPARLRPKTAFLFHVSQTVPLEAVKDARPAAWQNPRLVKPGTYAPAPGAHVDPPRELPHDRRPAPVPSEAAIDELAELLAEQTPPRVAPADLQGAAGLAILPDPQPTAPQLAAPQPTAAEELAADLAALESLAAAADETDETDKPAGRVEFEARLWFGANSRTKHGRHRAPTEAEALAACLAELATHPRRRHAAHVAVTRWTVRPDGGRTCQPFSGDMFHRAFDHAREIVADWRRDQAAEQPAPTGQPNRTAPDSPTGQPAPLADLPALPAELAGFLFAK